MVFALAARTDEDIKCKTFQCVLIWLILPTVFFFFLTSVLCHFPHLATLSLVPVSQTLQADSFLSQGHCIGHFSSTQWKVAHGSPSANSLTSSLQNFSLHYCVHLLVSLESKFHDSGDQAWHIWQCLGNAWHVVGSQKVFVERMFIITPLLSMLQWISNAPSIKPQVLTMA